jgi:hypothetical protein
MNTAANRFAPVVSAGIIGGAAIGLAGAASAAPAAQPGSHWHHDLQPSYTR